MFNSIVNNEWKLFCCPPFFNPMDLDIFEPSENVTAHRVNVHNNNLEEPLWPPDGAHIVPE